MQLTIEEMMMLSEKLEKEQVRYHKGNKTNQISDSLQIINQLQNKLRHQTADLSNEERTFLRDILQNEIKHIHGHGTRIYRSIMNKLT